MNLYVSSVALNFPVLLRKVSLWIPGFWLKRSRYSVLRSDSFGVPAHLSEFKLLLLVPYPLAIVLGFWVWSHLSVCLKVGFTWEFGSLNESWFVDSVGPWDHAGCGASIVAFPYLPEDATKDWFPNTCFEEVKPFADAPKPVFPSFGLEKHYFVNGVKLLPWTFSDLRKGTKPPYLGMEETLGSTES